MTISLKVNKLTQQKKYFKVNFSFHKDHDKDIIEFFQMLKKNKSPLIDFMRKLIRSIIRSQQVIIEGIQKTEAQFPEVKTRSRPRVIYGINPIQAVHIRNCRDEFRDSFEEIKDKFPNIFKNFEKWG